MIDRQGRRQVGREKWRKGATAVARAGGGSGGGSGGTMADVDPRKSV